MEPSRGPPLRGGKEVSYVRRRGFGFGSMRPQCGRQATGPAEARVRKIDLSELIDESRLAK